MAELWPVQNAYLVNLRIQTASIGYERPHGSAYEYHSRNNTYGLDCFGNNVRFLSAVEFLKSCRFETRFKIVRYFP